MKNFFYVFIFLSNVFFVGCSYGFDEFSYEKITSIEKPEAVVFVVKIGGPIPCGAHHLLIDEFKDENRLSCLNDKVNEKIERFNSKNQDEIFLVVSNVKGTLSNGEVFKAKNKSGMASVYGEKYLIFLNNNQEYLFFKQCTVFDSYFYENLLKSESKELTFKIVKDFVIKNNSLCKYE